MARSKTLPPHYPPLDHANLLDLDILYQFQSRDAIKAARIEATKACIQYIEEPKTSQRRWRFDLELELVKDIAAASAKG